MDEIAEDKRKTVRTLCYKTKICPWNNRGRCNRGDSCNFAHSATEKKVWPLNAFRALHKKVDIINKVNYGVVSKADAEEELMQQELVLAESLVASSKALEQSQSATCLQEKKNSSENPAEKASTMPTIEDAPNEPWALSGISDASPPVEQKHPHPDSTLTTTTETDSEVDRNVTWDLATAEEKLAYKQLSSSGWSLSTTASAGPGEMAVTEIVESPCTPCGTSLLGYGIGVMTNETVCDTLQVKRGINRSTSEHCNDPTTAAAILNQPLSVLDCNNNNVGVLSEAEIAKKRHRDLMNRQDIAGAGDVLHPSYQSLPLPRMVEGDLMNREDLAGAGGVLQPSYQSLPLPRMNAAPALVPNVQIVLPPFADQSHGVPFFLAPCPQPPTLMPPSAQHLYAHHCFPGFGDSAALAATAEDGSSSSYTAGGQQERFCFQPVSSSGSGLLVSRSSSSFGDLPAPAAPLLFQRMSQLELQAFQPRQYTE